MEKRKSPAAPSHLCHSLSELCPCQHLEVLQLWLRSAQLLGTVTLGLNQAASSSRPSSFPRVSSKQNSLKMPKPDICGSTSIFCSSLGDLHIKHEKTDRGKGLFELFSPSSDPALTAQPFPHPLCSRSKVLSTWEEILGKGSSQLTKSHHAASGSLKSLFSPSLDFNLIFPPFPACILLLQLEHAPTQNSSKAPPGAIPMGKAAPAREKHSQDSTHSQHHLTEPFL